MPKDEPAESRWMLNARQMLARASAENMANILTIIRRNSENQTEIQARNTEALAGLIEQFQAITSQNMLNLVSILSDNSENILGLLSNEVWKLTTRLEEVEQELAERLVMQRRFLPMETRAPRRAAPRIIDPPTLEEAFARLQAAAPESFPAFRACLDAGTRSYEGLPATSCSTGQHAQSLLFQAFLRPYLRGHVLDIGCGPQPVPSYLEGFPVGRIFGIDPISSSADHPFAFVPGVGEFLPFEDGVFDVLVSGTTLDHYFLLDRGIAEAARVLRPGGHFVAWIAEFAGAPPYDPYAGAAVPFDEEHMYHIDRAWFLPMMEQAGFATAEVIAFRRPFNYLFMSFAKR